MTLPAVPGLGPRPFTTEHGTTHQTTDHYYRGEKYMAWVRLSDDFYDHPKFDKAGALGVALFVSGLAWANRNLTDGFIPRRGHRSDRPVAPPARLVGVLSGLRQHHRAGPGPRGGGHQPRVAHTRQSRRRSGGRGRVDSHRPHPLPTVQRTPDLRREP